MKNKIKSKKKELKNPNINNTNNIGTNMSSGAGMELLLWQVNFSHNTFETIGQDITNDDDEKTLVRAILNA